MVTVEGPRNGALFFSPLTITPSTKYILSVSDRKVPVGKNGLVAIVDRRDHTRISKYKWNESSGYAYRSRNGRTVTMAAEVMGASDGELIDHRNGKGLDNRRSNLRPATRSQNMMNKGLSKKNTSGFKGVSRSGGRWAAVIGNNGQQVYLGSFDTPQMAALAYDEAARKLHGEHARYNFPKTGEAGVKDMSQGQNAKSYARKTITIPIGVMRRIDAYLAANPGLTASSFLTDAAVRILDGKGAP